MDFNESRFSCEGCPCLNIDYEQGQSCNLGYDCELRWDENKELQKTSLDCKLVAVTYKDGVFYRSDKFNYTPKHPEHWKD
jgi:hypothetical protein